MYGPTCIFWANLTPFSLKSDLSCQLLPYTLISQLLRVRRGRPLTQATNMISHHFLANYALSWYNWVQ